MKLDFPALMSVSTSTLKMEEILYTETSVTACIINEMTTMDNVVSGFVHSFRVRKRDKCIKMSINGDRRE
jgi:hypothetical protein